MLQLAELNRRAAAALEAEGGWPPAWGSMAELEARADEAVKRLRARRLEMARRGSWALAWRAALERRLDTDAVEFLDRPDVPEGERLAIVRKLHVLNRALLSYQRFLSVLRPHILEIARETGRPARLLELASGSGEFTLELGRLAERRGLPVQLTGSDIVQAYVEDADYRALTQGVPVRFRQLNAFDLGCLQPGEVDLLFIAQSVHHFTPGQLARMIAEGQRAGARRFIAVDGRRSLFLLGFLPLVTAVGLDRRFMHDSFVSARRFFAEAELALIARVAAPGARVEVRRSEPAFSILTVRYP